MALRVQFYAVAFSSSLALGGCGDADPLETEDGSSSTADGPGSSGSTPDPSAGTPDPDTTGASADTGTATTGDSGDDQSATPPISFDLGVLPDAPVLPEPIPDFDCNDAPDEFVSFELITGPRGYHGLEIATNGLMIGSDGTSLIDSTYNGDWGVFIPGLGAGQQMDWLPNGDLAHATTNPGTVSRVRLDGTTEVIRPNLGAYGVVLGPDNQLYITTGNGGNLVERLDPLTGDIETIITSPGPTLHSVGFSVDGTRMYIGTISGGGTVYYVDFNGAMDPGPTNVFTTDATLNGSNWHDAIAVDACGYVYVTDYSSRNMWRMTPGGDGILFWDPANQGHYAHGLVWGTGEDGWLGDALYFPQPYNNNNVGEVVVGVPPATFGGIVSNALPPL